MQKRVIEAARYSLFAGGKRLRPILCLAAAEVAGGDIEPVLPAACALEMIHTYSLIHDDLPAMDNDDFRRGVPTNHKVFGEAIAILAGDALLTEAFEYFALGANNRVSAEKVVEVIRIAVKAAGYRGMIGGQVIDLECENRKVDLATVEYMHIHKTGALLSASLEIGAILGGGDEVQIKALKSLRPSFRACVSDYRRSAGCRGRPRADGQNTGIGRRQKQNDLSGSCWVLLNPGTPRESMWRVLWRRWRVST